MRDSIELSIASDFILFSFNEINNANDRIIDCLNKNEGVIVAYYSPMCNKSAYKS